jgi:Tfp pilus assembly protein PilF
MDHRRPPYKGLMPYAEDDVEFFFGRDRETEIIIENLRASRLTLLDGSSGVGKSSVLRAGVASKLRRIARENIRARGSPRMAVVVFNSWRHDPVRSLAACVPHSVQRLFESPGNGQPRSLAEMFESASAQVKGDLLIILDQFEEYFLYHSSETGDGTFAEVFPRVVNDSSLRVHFLISIRDDAVASLDCFKGKIPNLFDNYLRIDHLDRDGAIQAIREPLAAYNSHLPPEQQMTIENDLVEAVLEQVRIDRISISEGGRGLASSQSSEIKIETPFLQMVLTRLWDEEINAPERALRRSTLARLGEAESIVRTHLNKIIEKLDEHEQDIAASVCSYLVTPTGSKIACTIDDLASYAELTKEQVRPVLEKLQSKEVRVLRHVPGPSGQEARRFEIFHDVLAPAVLDWFQRRTVDQRALRKVRRWAIGALALGFVIAVALAAIPISHWRRAEALRKGAQSHYVLGIRYLDADKYEQASVELKRAIQLEDSSHSRLPLSLTYICLDRLDEAETELRQALKFENDNDTTATIHRFLGMVYECRGRDQDAEKEYAVAMSFRPDASAFQAHSLFDSSPLERQFASEAIAADILNSLGYLYLRQGKLDEATKEFHAAISLDPVEYTAYLNLGTVFALQGDMKAAQKWWHDGVLLCPPSSQIDNLNYALFTIASGDFKTGTAELQRILIDEKPPLGVLKELMIDAQFFTRSKEKIEGAEAAVQMIQNAIAADAAPQQ